MLPFGRLWYAEPNLISNAVGYAQFYSRSNKAVVRVYHEAGTVIETHEHADEFKEWRSFLLGHVIERFRLARFARS
jgi:hypothetical protein